MLDEEVNKVLEKFAERVITESRKNLSRNKINASKDLYKSLDYDLKVMPNSIALSLLMEDYGKFIDKGVKGVKSSKKAPRSPYSYKVGTKNVKPPANKLLTWVKRKRGAYRKRNDKSTAFAVQNIIYNYGIKTTNFFTRPFELAYKRLPDELVEAYGLDLENFIEFTLKEDGNI